MDRDPETTTAVPHEPPGLGVWILVAAIILVISILCVREYLRQYPNTDNRFVLGAGAPVEGEIPLPLYDATELTGKPSEEILRARVGAVLLHRSLLEGAYIPRPQLFSRIRPDRPWMSIRGYAYGGSGEELVSGRSYEALVLNNPHLLVAPDFWGLSKWRD
jgi:hypothetical protein